jgi:hypothetical protein
MAASSLQNCYRATTTALGVMGDDPSRAVDPLQAIHGGVEGMDAEIAVAVPLSSPAAAQRCAEGARLDSGAATAVLSAMPSIALPYGGPIPADFPPRLPQSVARLNSVSNLHQLDGRDLNKLERGGAPCARRRPKPGSGPRRHDGCGYFIASVTHRRTLPVPQPRCAMASERWCYAACPAELTSSKTEPATLRRLQSSIHHLITRSAHHSPAPPRRQIAIDGHLPCRPPRVPSLEAFGRRRSARVDRSRRGRHPKPFI